MQPARGSAPEQIGPFELRALLGRGGGGEAWAGVHTPTGAEVVLKRPTPGDPAAAERLHREIVLSAGLQHPHVVRVLDARRARDGAPPYLVLARAQRGALSQLPAFRDPLALLRVLLDALAGLAHLHARGLLHLDVKPSNLFVREGARGPRVQVGDLGAAIPRWTAGTPARQGLAGTSGFMAPEHQAGDLASLGPWTDLWSLGATARALAAEPPPWLHPWLERSLASSPGDRFPSAAAAALALREASPRAPREALDLATRAPLRPVAPERSQTCTTPFQQILEDLPPTDPSLPGGPNGVVYDLNAPDSSVDDPSSLPSRPVGERGVGGGEVSPEEEELPPGLGAGAVGVRRPPLVGREAQREALEAAWTGALEGNGGLVLLEGPSGAGTSRLGEWLADLAQTRDGAAVLEVRLGAAGSGLSGALRRWALGAGRCPGQSAADHVALRLAAERLPPSPELLRGLAALLEGRDASPERLAALLGGLLGALRGRGPVLLFVDALDEARGSLVWLEGAVDRLARPASHGALVLATRARPGRGADGPRIDAHIPVATIPVPPLDRFPSEQLASRLLGFADLTSQQVAARCAGLPGHLVEHVAAWVRSGALMLGPDGFCLAPESAPPVPSTLANRVLRRLEAALGPLDPPARLALAVSALLDGDDGRGTLPAALLRMGLDAPDPGALQRAGLVLAAEGGWRWAIPGVGEALLEGEERAREARRVSGEALDPGGKLEGPRCARVAQLLEEAGEPSAALEAVGRVLSVDLSPDVARGLLEVLDRVAPRVRGPGEPALVAGLRGRMHFERGNHGEARAGAEAARAGAEASLRRGSAEERRVAAAQLHALHVLALMQVIEGRDTEEALRLSREAAAWAGRLEPDDAQAARLLEARLLIIASRSAEAVVLLEGCQGEDDAQLREATRWRGWLLLGDAYSGAGEPARSIAPCRRAVAAMQEAGGHWLLGQGYNTLADALMRLRRFEEAIATLHLALGELYPRSPTAGYVRANLAFCHLLLGQREASARWIDDAFAHLPINSRHRLWCLLQSLRLPLLAATELAALDACCDELEAWLVGQRIAISEPMEAATLAAEALVADPPRAARLFALARRLAAHVEDPALVAALQPRWP